MGKLRKIAARRPRLTGFTCLAAALLFVVFMLSPSQLPVVLHKLSLVTLAGVLGYWLHRHAFPVEINRLIEEASHDARVIPMVSGACISRAIVIGCAMLAVGLAL